MVLQELWQIIRPVIETFFVTSARRERRAEVLSHISSDFFSKLSAAHRLDMADSIAVHAKVEQLIGRRISPAKLSVLNRLYECCPLVLDFHEAEALAPCLKVNEDGVLEFDIPKEVGSPLFLLCVASASFFLLVYQLFELNWSPSMLLFIALALFFFSLSLGCAYWCSMKSLWKSKERQINEFLSGNISLKFSDQDKNNV